MAEEGRITIVEAKLPTAKQQLQREADATEERKECRHNLPLMTSMPVHYVGEWICDDCDFVGTSKPARSPLSDWTMGAHSQIPLRDGFATLVAR